MTLFQKAVKQQLFARIALFGPPGAGKTYSSLAIATGLGRNIALIDTEHGKSKLYSDDFDFSMVEARPPFTPQRYIGAINAAAAEGFDALIIDSLSHAWSGQGGVLDIVNAAGGRFQDWQKGSPLWQQMVDTILAAPLHIIVCFRSKVAYEVGEGGKKVEKLGLAPEARQGIEYEFDVVGEVNMSHQVSITKSRLRDLQDAVLNKPGPDVGKQIAAWLASGEKPPAAPPGSAPSPEAPQQELARESEPAEADASPAPSQPTLGGDGDAEGARPEADPSPLKEPSFYLELIDQAVTAGIAKLSPERAVLKLNRLAMQHGGVTIQEYPEVEKLDVKVLRAFCDELKLTELVPQ